MSGYLFIAITVVLNASSQLLMKCGVERLDTSVGLQEAPLRFGLMVVTNPFIFLGLTTMTISMGTHLAALSRFDVGYVFPFISFAYVIVAVFGVLFLGEEVNANRVIGIGIIIIGVAILARG